MIKFNKKIILLILIVGGSLYYLISLKLNKDVDINTSINKTLKYDFFNSGVTKDSVNIYVKNDDEYNIVGRIGKKIYLEFTSLVDKYLLIDGFEADYYVEVENIIPVSENAVEVDSRYKKYIYFNENIKTNNKTSFYDFYDNLIYTFELSYDFPIIVKDENRYGVEFNEQLLYVHKKDVKSIYTSVNTDKKNSSGVGVLNYHFFYDNNNDLERQKCNQVICQSTTQFQNELEYIKANNILTINTKELEWYIDGKINLPKSVLITIDDGWMMEHGINILEENEMNACVFLVTSWFEDTSFKDKYKYIEFHSHGEKLHDVGVCSGGQGGAIKCLEEEKLLDDLTKSRNKLNGSNVFAYPFYEYNDYAIEILKKAGFSMAFVGESVGSDNLVHVGSNKYELPRFVMVNYTTENDLDNYFKNIK